MAGHKTDKPTKNITLTVRLDHELDAELRRLAGQFGCSLNELIYVILTQWERENRPAKESAGPEIQVHGETDDE